MEFNKEERKRYVLKTKRDKEILSKIHEIENLPDLTSNEKFLVLFIRTQLEKEWRMPIILLLDDMLNRKKRKWKRIKERASFSFWQPK